MLLPGQILKGMRRVLFHIEKSSTIYRVSDKCGELVDAFSSDWSSIIFCAVKSLLAQSQVISLWTQPRLEYRDRVDHDKSRELFHTFQVICLHSDFVQLKRCWRNRKM